MRIPLSSAVAALAKVIALLHGSPSPLLYTHHPTAPRVAVSEPSARQLVAPYCVGHTEQLYGAKHDQRQQLDTKTAVQSQQLPCGGEGSWTLDIATPSPLL